MISENDSDFREDETVDIQEALYESVVERSQLSNRHEVVE